MIHLKDPRRVLSKEYLTKGHGRFLLKLMRFLAEHKPMNMYELAKEMNSSYALIHKSINELKAVGLLYKSKKKKSKHETDLWELSVSGLWLLLQNDKKINWEKIKSVSPNLLKTYANYFEIQSFFGIVDNEYCNLSSHSYPNPGMIAKSLIFFKVGKNTEYVDRIYEQFMKKISNYDHRILRSIKKEIEKEQVNLKAFLEHSRLIHEKLQKAEISSRIKNN